MPAKVLVAFATMYGSTHEVAEAVAGELRDRGVEADLQPVREARTIEGYDAVVLGAPLVMHHWPKDALGFLSRHRHALEGRPVAVFALGPVHDPHDETEWREGRAQLDAQVAKLGWLRPAALELFGGRFDPALLRFPLNKLAGAAPASDIRDWENVRHWAGALPSALGVSGSVDDAGRTT